MHYSNSENTHLNESHINNINSEHEQIIEKYEQKVCCLFTFNIRELCFMAICV